MALTTEEILEQLDCLNSSPLTDTQFQYFLLYLTANNLSGEGSVMGLTTEEILEQLDCLNSSPLTTAQFQNFLLYLTANNVSGDGDVAPLTTEEIVEELDCLNFSQLPEWQFQQFLLYLTANNVSSGGAAPSVTTPTFQPTPTSFVVPSVFMRLSSPDVGVTIRYTEDPVLIPNLVYTVPVRANLADEGDLSITYRSQANSADGLTLSTVASKTLTTTIPWTHVWNLDLNGNDSVGGVNLDPKGSVVFNTAPNLNTANFDGLAGLMTTETATMKNATFTMSCWAKLTSNDLMRVLWVFERDNSNEGLGLFVHADLSLEVQLLQNIGYIQPRTAINTLVLDTWQNHVVTADGTNCKYYCNGVEKASMAYNGTIDPIYLMRLTVGSEIVGVDTPRYGIFGNVDRVYYLPAALTAPQVLQLYNEDLLHTKL